MAATKKQHENSAEKIIFNVGGAKFQLSKSELNRQPDGRLADTETLSRYYRSELNEYYFDRNPRAFKAIATFYKTGKLHLPKDVCGSEFHDELLFWRINPELLEDCCWVRYQRAVRGGNVTPGATRVIPGYEGSNVVWKILENVHPSWLTIIYPVISSTVIIVMLTFLGMKTMPEYKHYRVVNETNRHDAVEEDDTQSQGDPFFYVHVNCLCFFILELCAYVVFYVQDMKRAKKRCTVCAVFRPIIVLDVLHTGAYAMYFISYYSPTTYPFLCLKVFRILWFMRFWTPGRGLTYILQTKWQSVGFLVVAINLTGVFFSIWVHFSEAGSEDSHFRHMNGILYWALITLTTVGYGDFRPIGVYGKLVGTFCGLFGVVFIALSAVFFITMYLDFFRIGQYKRRPGEEMEAKVTNVGGEDIPLTAKGEPNVSETVTFLAHNAVFEINKTCLDDVAFQKFPRDSRGVFKLNGDAECVAAVINYYRTGRLHVPQTVCGDEFKAELDKWGIKVHNISGCCWLRYKQSVSTYDVTSDHDVTSSGHEGCLTTVWNVLENTNPGWYTKLYVLISAVFIGFIMFTPPPTFMRTIDEGWWIKEVICICYFMIELCIRFIFCPHKRMFFLTPITILDNLSIAGMICALFVQNKAPFVSCFLLTLRALRGIHFVYFFCHLRLVRCLCYTVTAGLKDILYLLVLYASLTFFFATSAYSAEYNEEDSQLKSIIGALWWGFITITTVGYGDVTPVGTVARDIGVSCSITGVFMLSLVAAAIIHRFDEYMNDVQHRRVRKLVLYCCKGDNGAHYV